MHPLWWCVFSKRSHSDPRAKCSFAYGEASTRMSPLGDQELIRLPRTASLLQGLCVGAWCPPSQLAGCRLLVVWKTCGSSMTAKAMVCAGLELVLKPLRGTSHCLCVMSATQSWKLQSTKSRFSKEKRKMGLSFKAAFDNLLPIRKRRAALQFFFPDKLSSWERFDLR